MAVQQEACQDPRLPNGGRCGGRQTQAQSVEGRGRPIYPHRALSAARMSFSLASCSADMMSITTAADCSATASTTPWPRGCAGRRHPWMASPPSEKEPNTAAGGGCGSSWRGESGPEDFDACDVQPGPGQGQPECCSHGCSQPAGASRQLDFREVSMNQSGLAGMVEPSSISACCSAHGQSERYSRC